MSSLRQDTRQMLVYLSTLSLGIITFHRTYDKNILHILSVTNVLVYGGTIHVPGISKDGTLIHPCLSDCYIIIMLSIIC